jgi:hypothetical protein
MVTLQNVGALINRGLTKLVLPSFDQWWALRAGRSGVGSMRVAHAAYLEDAGYESPVRGLHDAVCLSSAWHW